MAAVDGLVALAVLLGIRLRGLVAPDVGRQGHVADAGQRAMEVLDRGEAQGAFTKGPGGDDLGGEHGHELFSPVAVFVCKKRSVSPI